VRAGDEHHGRIDPLGGARACYTGMTIRRHSKGASMLTITAIIRAKKGHEATMRRALLHVADHVRINEPSTVGFFVSQDGADPCVFTTYERFADQAAMDRHN
jgi:Antibiotic biosynthesis monooxygenase